MGSATREALAGSKAALAALGTTADLATAEDLFAAARAIGDSAQLRAVISDPSADAAGKSALISRIFASQLSKPAVSLLETVAAQRWSNQDDVLAGIEELGIRAVAASARKDTSIESELFAFGAAVTSNAELELALGSKLGDPSSKTAVLEKLLSGKAADGTLAIVRQLVSQPRGRRLRVALQRSAAIVADQAGQAIATVTSATAIAPAQLERLASGLSKRYGANLTVNQVIDPAVIGGLRVQIGDDVIDGTIASRLGDVKLKLAG
jgi:F-type H+-transporting ATPase subunit delta